MTGRSSKSREALHGIGKGAIASSELSAAGGKDVENVLLTDGLVFGECLRGAGGAGDVGHVVDELTLSNLANLLVELTEVRAGTLHVVGSDCFGIALAASTVPLPAGGGDIDVHGDSDVGEGLAAVVHVEHMVTINTLEDLKLTILVGGDEGRHALGAAEEVALLNPAVAGGVQVVVVGLVEVGALLGGSPDTEVLLSSDASSGEDGHGGTGLVLAHLVCGGAEEGMGDTVDGLVVHLVKGGGHEDSLGEGDLVVIDMGRHDDWIG